ncbi:hypothetical protein JCM10212_002328 [Sporobolomyces blumeae]
MSLRTLASTTSRVAGRRLAPASSAAASIVASPCPCSFRSAPLRSLSTSLPRANTTGLPPSLPHHAHPNVLEVKEMKETSSSPDEVSALSLLKSQPSHYVSALLMGRRYLLTENDILTVPHLKNVPVGTKIALTRILEVGSRDYTLRANGLPRSHPAATVLSATSQALSANQAPIANASGRPLVPVSSRQVTVNGVPKDFQRYPDSLPYLSSEIVEADLIVVEHTKGKMFEVEKFKRRKGYRRHLRSKLEYTKLRMGPIRLGEGSKA